VTGRARVDDNKPLEQLREDHKVFFAVGLVMLTSLALWKECRQAQADVSDLLLKRAAILKIESDLPNNSCQHIVWNSRYVIQELWKDDVESRNLP
jgi:hypothetical protein